jgi:phosphotriesterase-related protein
MGKRVVTVLGDLDPNQMGIVLPHEHLLVDTRKDAHPQSSELAQRARFDEPVRQDNRGHVVYHPFHYRDNLVLSDMAIAIEELMEFKQAGGNAIVDLTLAQMGRDPAALRRISIATGIHIVMGSGRFAGNFWTDEETRMSIEQLTADIVEEFESGPPGSASRPGIIGEIGVSDIRSPTEVKNLKASARAQRKIGCAMNVHVPIWEKEGHAILDIIAEEGADPSKVVLSHLDETIGDADYHDSLAKRGAYVEYDQFGMHMMGFEGEFLPSDTERIKALKEQIRRGNLRKLLISQDTFVKIQLKRWGGFGYSHILENIVPRLKRAGISDEEIRVLLAENPKELIGW